MAIAPAVTKSLDMQLVEIRLGRPLEEVIRELYIDQGLSARQVAAELGTTQPTVTRWMARLGIPARKSGTS